MISKSKSTTTTTTTTKTPPINSYKKSNSDSHTNREQELQDYLGSKEFTFDNEEKSMKILKKAMEIVYLNNRPLVSIDVEAYERSQKKITEIGVVIYDPEQSKNSIFPVIKSFHIIVKEHHRFFNKTFVPDNKHRFMGGISYVLSLKDCKLFIEGVIEKYINEENGAFVGHHIVSDLKWLRSLGIKFDQNIDIVDTGQIYTISRSSGNLREILRSLGIPHALLHNAANDAYYTLLAAMALCDPNIRIRDNLDFHKPSPKLSNEDKKRNKFSDNAIVDDTVSVNELLEEI
ncbi:uncharacterized protein RJT21DRAFT_114272 [Scheffersomyces amazonensis]|uniref:uncharacterized protein n=1 Tax=Scheffersomyces amazonensis TaxID=1078765 RepID=UPI00315DCE20